MEYASFWKRALSFIIDLLFINVIIIWPFEASIMSYSIEIRMQDFPMKIYFIVFIIFILSMLYFTFFEYYLSQSPGQLLMKIKVESDKDIGFFKSLLRNIYLLPLFPFYLLWIIEPLYLIFYKERLLEKITNTRTVMQKSELYKKYNLRKV